MASTPQEPREHLRQALDSLEVDREAKTGEKLLRFRDGLVASGDAHNRPVEAAQDRIINLLDTFTYESMAAVPAMRAYVERQQA